MIAGVTRSSDLVLHGADAVYDKTTFGFWIYIMTDCVAFATLFAVYAVLRNNTFGGPSARELFNLQFALAQTFILLLSSYTSGLFLLASKEKAYTRAVTWLGVTFLLGAWFLSLELYEFQKLVSEGNSWQRSAFLSSYFTLVGTHGFHIAIGLIWIGVLLGRITKKGFSDNVIRQLTCFGMYWHFLDVIWIFIFTIVYLMGAL